MSYTLKPAQLAQVEQPKATESLTGQHMLGSFSYDVNQTRRFHEAVGLPVRNDWTYIPPVSERIFRAKLILEEVLETFEAMGLRLVHSCNDGEYEQPLNEYNWDIQHIEGSVYDPIETADGIADIKVVANGTALQFGIPQRLVDIEVWASNMSKLDENGNPIVNRCMDGSCELALDDVCENLSHLLDPSQPVGKVLKPSTYVKANIARLYDEHRKGEL